MSDTVTYQADDRIARITLNRPEAMNALIPELTEALEDAVERANADDGIHVIVVSGSGDGFCGGYDLNYFAQATEGDGHNLTQDMPWDPMKDYAFMGESTRRLMSLWRSAKPTIAQIHGHAVAGGSDMALCCDLIIMAEDATIGYMPARVWGCPTTAMWTYRLGPQMAKRMVLTGDTIDGTEAERIGLALKAVPADKLAEEVDGLANRMATVPINQLTMNKMVVNQAIEAMGLSETQRLATVFDGITRHSPEGLAFKRRSETMGWKQAVRERDLGTYDWTADRPINPKGK